MFEIPKFEVGVCRARNCERRGAEEVFDLMKEELADAANIQTVRYSCFMACERGPNVRLTLNVPGDWPIELKFFDRVGREEPGGRTIEDVAAETKELIQE